MREAAHGLFLNEHLGWSPSESSVHCIGKPLNFTCSSCVRARAWNTFLEGLELMAGSGPDTCQAEQASNSVVEIRRALGEDDH